MTNRIFCVTLAFNPPGPLHSSLLIAPDETMAAAMAMQSAMAVVPEHASLVGTAVFVVDPDVLRQMLRAVEGRGPGEVVSLVPKATAPAERDEWRKLGDVSNPIARRAAEILRQHPETDAPVPDLSWARPSDWPIIASMDNDSFMGGAQATVAGEHVGTVLYREQFGPPVPRHIMRQAGIYDGVPEDAA